ncbi:MAG: hypothetical protein EU981_01085 [Candidatus Liberibacter ctenarytainae]|uniref:Lipoprotein n=1 Tax=Candidatus Liberibacter ctenarytainae TaxID=2020335 RepID=A0A937ABX7_9HYPH|nr:hypothetical protein [Candidatus Liberibacter ctenarytainae]
MNRAYLLCCLLLVLQGCYMIPNIAAVGGSKSDGTVVFEYIHDSFSTKQISVAQLQSTQESAARKCVNWGYKSAEPFGGVQSKCLNASCGISRVRIPFQCY